jgi:hypothetical protein
MNMLRHRIASAALLFGEVVLAVGMGTQRHRKRTRVSWPIHVGAQHSSVASGTSFSIMTLPGAGG